MSIRNSMTATEDGMSATFRQVMALVCTPVAVVTTMVDDRPHGTTVSAFASLSMKPPMIVVALDRTSTLLSLIKTTKRLGVNVLASTQSALAMGFAQKGDDKFQEVSWHIEEGLPRLDGSGGWLACDVINLVDGGDHMIAVAQVRKGDTTPTPPLTYHNRGFGTHASLQQ